MGHSALTGECWDRIVFRLEESLSHMMKISRITDNIDILEPIDDTMFHLTKESG